MLSLLFKGQTVFNSLPHFLFCPRTIWRIGWIAPGWFEEKDKFILFFKIGIVFWSNKKEGKQTYDTASLTIEHLREIETTFDTVSVFYEAYFFRMDIIKILSEKLHETVSLIKFNFLAEHSSIWSCPLGRQPTAPATREPSNHVPPCTHSLL